MAGTTATARLGISLEIWAPTLLLLESPFPNAQASQLPTTTADASNLARTSRNNPTFQVEDSHLSHRPDVIQNQQISSSRRAPSASANSY